VGGALLDCALLGWALLGWALLEDEPADAASLGAPAPAGVDCPDEPGSASAEATGAVPSSAAQSSGAPSAVVARKMTSSTR
jgi:hypothetical protein